MLVHRISAFTDAGKGGNAAGVALLDEPCSSEVMQQVARQVGYPETAFLERDGEEWAVRYFAPEIEVPFCGHATIAAGIVLGEKFGAGEYCLRLADERRIPLTVAMSDGGWEASFDAPPVWSRPMREGMVAELLELFGLAEDDLDPRLPPSLINAGNTHPFLALKDRQRLSQLGYCFAHGKALQLRERFATIHVVHAETEQLFHARAPFAIGGFYEDPATGASAAALAGFLREIGWPCEGRFETIQGEDIGQRSRVMARFGPEPSDAVTISGHAAKLAEPLEIGTGGKWNAVFFYGLLMDVDTLRTAGCRILGGETADLLGYKLRMASKAVVEECEDAHVPGYLVAMREKDFRGLYAKLPEYVRRSVRVRLHGNGEEIEAVTMLHRYPQNQRGSDPDYAAKYAKLCQRLGLPRPDLG